MHSIFIQWHIVVTMERQVAHSLSQVGTLHCPLGPQKNPTERGIMITPTEKLHIGWNLARNIYVEPENG